MEVREMPLRRRPREDVGLSEQSRIYVKNEVLREADEVYLT